MNILELIMRRRVEPSVKIHSAARCGNDRKNFEQKAFMNLPLTDSTLCAPFSGIVPRYFACFAFFALFWIWFSDICHIGLDTYRDAFYLSVETQMTIGYGFLVLDKGSVLFVPPLSVVLIAG